MRWCVAVPLVILAQLAPGLQAFHFDRGEEPPAIWIHPECEPVVKYAASELAFHLKESLAQECSIRQSDLLEVAELRIAGDAVRLAAPELQTAVDSYTLQIRPDSISVYAASGNERGVLYGVYALLEDDFRCRWYTPELTVIPEVEHLEIAEGVRQYAPPVQWREVFYYEAAEPVFAGRQRLNGNTSGRCERSPGRRVIDEGAHGDWGLWCHSMFSLLDPELYQTHPEYFAEVDGKRVAPKPDGTQACMTDPAVADIVIEALRKKIAATPPPSVPWAGPLRYWSVSQMDGRGYCTCSRCAAVDRENGSPIGSILQLVNRVAEAFPDYRIGTLAYDYSRHVPGATRLQPNVVIQLCSIEAPRVAANEPVSTSPKHQSFRDDIVNWGRLCNDIVLWDYVVQFQNLVAPYPNWNVLQDNIRFYAGHHVTGIFCQGNRDRGGEFAELRAYLLSKLLWDPDCDLERHRQDFLAAWYGAAAPCIAEYLARQERELAKSGLPLSMDGEVAAHRNGFLSEANLRVYNELFDQAEAAVAADPERLNRVRKERLGIQYVQLRLRYGTPEERRKVLADFTACAEKNGVWMLSEVDWREDQAGNRAMFFKRISDELDAEDNEHGR